MQGFSYSVCKSLAVRRCRDGTAEVRSLSVLGGAVCGHFVLQLLWIKSVLWAPNLSSLPLLLRRDWRGI